MLIKIYQINKERDVDDAIFEGYDETLKLHDVNKINADIYDKVFEGLVDCDNLEDIYYEFNCKGNSLNRGHSLSVSDVVEVCNAEKSIPCDIENGCYFCDITGFKKIEFDTFQTQTEESLLRVLMIEPHKVPYRTDIKNTLESVQSAVRGMIELVYNDDGTIIVCNDEAKLIGMDGNRKIGECTIIAGPFFIVGEDGEDFGSLTEEQLSKYEERFSEIKEITQQEVENDMGITFIAL